MKHSISKLMRGTAPAHLLARGTLVSFVIQGCGAGLIFLSEIILARILKSEGYGLYAMVMAWFQVLTMVALFGSNFLLLRLVPMYRSEENWSLLGALLRHCSRITIFISGVILTATIAWYALAREGSAELRLAFIIGFASLPLQALSLQRQSILRGFHHVAKALTPDVVVRPLLLILILAALAWGMKIPVTAHTALGLFFVSVLGAYLLGKHWQQRVVPAAPQHNSTEDRSREWMAIAFPLFLIAGMQLLIMRMDIMMLAAMAGREQAGFYTAASRVADLVIFALATANTIVAPMIAGLHARNDIEGLQNMLTLLAKGMLLFTIPLVVVIGLFGQTILGAFGSDYQVAYTALLILVVGQMVNALSGPVGFLLSMTGHQMQSLRILMVVTVINFILNLVLIPAYGITGAAVATAVSTILWNLLMARSIRRSLGVEASVLVLLREK